MRKLIDLEVKSFVTLARSEQSHVNGGDGIEASVIKVDLPNPSGGTGPCGPPVCITYDCPTRAC